MAKAKQMVYKVHVEKGIRYIKKDGYAWDVLWDHFYTRKANAKIAYERLMKSDEPGRYEDLKKSFNAFIVRFVKTDRGWAVIQLSAFHTKILGFKGKYIVVPEHKKYAISYYQKKHTN